jgi:hypothetical protein
LLFGLSIVWLVYPRLEVQFAEMAESQARKLTQYGATDDALPAD